MKDKFPSVKYYKREIKKPTALMWQQLKNMYFIKNGSMYLIYVTFLIF